MPIIAVIAIGSTIWQSTAIQSMGFPCTLTEDNAEGPYYIENALTKERLGVYMEGQRLIVSGQILDRNCDPVPNAIVDLWQTDAHGDYYFDDYTLRGKIYADENGKYAIDTIFPGKYQEDGIFRPAHLHLKIFSSEDNRESLTSQLYFAGDKDHDWLVKQPLIMDYKEINNIKYSEFDFVIIP